MKHSPVLVTGGTGYIGSHACVELLGAGHPVVILDNLSNSRKDVVQRIGRIAGEEPAFIEGDVRDSALLDQVLHDLKIGAVMHFAGLKAVGESVAQPLRYYDNNVNGSLKLLESMAAAGVRSLVFSSSATVYGAANRLPIEEDAPLNATNPYGRSKLMVEQMLQDLAQSDPGWNIAILRYFNPVGAHPSGLIGERPQGVPNNLMPYICQVAAGEREYLQVFGNDYPTPDGTGVRDYIHVVDLVRGHLRALEHLETAGGLHVYNLGTGQGYSVLELVRAFEQTSGKQVPYRIGPRRAGDVASCYASCNKALTELGWRAERGITEMCEDAWRWQCNHAQDSSNSIVELTNSQQLV